MALHLTIRLALAGALLRDSDMAGALAAARGSRCSSTPMLDVIGRRAYTIRHNMILYDATGYSTLLRSALV